MARKRDLNKIVPELSVSIAEYNRELDEANAQIDRGEYFTNEEVFEMTIRIIEGKDSREEIDAYMENILKERRASFAKQNGRSR